MFTGLVEEVGHVLRLVRRPEGAHLFVRATRVLEGTRLGDSIAVSGACLTVVHLGAADFAVDCMAETLEHSTVGELRSGDEVNLERAMRLGDRLGGHLVLGHVDGVGQVLSVRTRGIAQEVRVSLPAGLRGYVAGKGSVAVDGISLTVTDVTADDFGLGIIPHTLAATTLRRIAAGRRVNLEADVLARYVRHTLLTSPQAGGGPTPVSRTGGTIDPATGLSEEQLRRSGFLD
jgi:riboflavin synthase